MVGAPGLIKTRRGLDKNMLRFTRTGPGAHAYITVHISQHALKYANRQMHSLALACTLSLFVYPKAIKRKKCIHLLFTKM